MLTWKWVCGVTDEHAGFADRAVADDDALDRSSGLRVLHLDDGVGEEEEEEEDEQNTPLVVFWDISLLNMSRFLLLFLESCTALIFHYTSFINMVNFLSGFP